MEIIKETQYLSFQLVPTKGTTKRIAVVNRHHQETIGEIKWFGSWRQYCFFPYTETIWNTTCMEDVQGVIKDLMDERN